MKFATLALIGTVSAHWGSISKVNTRWGSISRRVPPSEDELIEEARTHYPAKTVGAWFKGMGELEGVMKEAHADFRKKHPHFRREMKEFGQWAGERYGPDLEAWGRSESVRAVQMHKRAMVAKSSELHVLMSDVFTLVNEFMSGRFEMGAGFNKDGSYDE